MRKVVLYIAVSLDGYIADEKGGVGWLSGQEKDRETDCGYEDFIQGVDTVIMGRRTYEQIVTELSPDFWPYEGKESIVLTHRPMEKKAGVLCAAGPVREILDEKKKGRGGDIWICGGAQVAGQCIEENLIDEYRLSILPVLLGKGVPLFPKGGRTIPLRLVSGGWENGILNCAYVRR